MKAKGINVLIAKQADTPQPLQGSLLIRQLGLLRIRAPGKATKLLRKRNPSMRGSHPKKEARATKVYSFLFFIKQATNTSLCPHKGKPHNTAHTCEREDPGLGRRSSEFPQGGALSVFSCFLQAPGKGLGPPGRSILLWHAVSSVQANAGGGGWGRCSLSSLPRRYGASSHP